VRRDFRIRWPAAWLSACSCVIALAGCGGEEPAPERVQAGQSTRVDTAIPAVLAERLADRADRVAEFGTACEARRRRADELRSAAEAAIGAGRVPVALQPPLRSRIDAIARPRPCLREADLRRADDLARWLRKRSAGVLRTPPDFRVARSSVADDPSDEVVWAVIEPMWWALETPYEPDPRLAQATPGQRAAYALTWTESEVSNGGFEQYFWNSTGMLLDDAIVGARLIGAKDVEDVLRGAAALFPGGRVPESRLVRQNVIESFSPADNEELGRLDDRFFALLEHPAKSPTRLLEKYIRTNPDEFFLPS
jgi:hypothetical protein